MEVFKPRVSRSGLELPAHELWYAFLESCWERLVRGWLNKYYKAMEREVRDFRREVCYLVRLAALEGRRWPGGINGRVLRS